MGKMLGVIGNKAQFIRISEKVNVALQDMSIAMGPSTSDFVHCLNFGGGGDKGGNLLWGNISQPNCVRRRLQSTVYLGKFYAFIEIYSNIYIQYRLTVDCVRQFIFIITHIC